MMNDEGEENNYLWLSFWLFPFAFLFDFLDGFVARATKRQSFIGADLDSLSDIVRDAVGHIYFHLRHLLPFLL